MPIKEADRYPENRIGDSTFWFKSGFLTYQNL